MLQLPFLSRVLGLVAATLLVTVAACGGDPSESGAPDTAPDAPSRADAGGAADVVSPDLVPDVAPDDVGSDVAPVVEIVSLRIVPRDGTFDTRVGVPLIEQLNLLVLRSDSTEVPVTAGVRWESSDAEIAEMGSDARLRISGQRAGRVTITGSYDGYSASAEFLVRLTDVIFADELLPDVAAGFAGYEPAGSAAAMPIWQYPADNTMFPAGILPPVFQWDAGGNAVFRLTFVRGDALRVDVYTTQPRYQPSVELWQAIARGYGVPIELELSGRESAAAEETRFASPRAIQTADAELAGDVYYWQVQTGDIMRIAEGESAPTPLFSTNAETGTCRGCHTLSHDGGRLGFMYNGGDNPRAGIAWTGAPEPAVIENGSAEQWTWFAFDPTGTRGLSIMNGQMHLRDVTPGLAGGVANLGPVPLVNDGGARLSHPSWSPDGSRVAYVSRNPGSSDWSYDWGDILQVSYDSASGAFGTPTMLVPRGATPETDTMSYPTWTPDNRFVGYLQGPDTVGGSPSVLMLADSQTGLSVRLANASPDGVDVFPSFSPYREGGYYWLLFYSRRPYGHLSAHKQLWVAAIDVDAPPGSDPSFPAFWLPGQDTERQNITGYWAPPICSNDGATCKDDTDCCTGFACVRDEALEQYVCRASACTVASRPCATSEECCSGYQCAPSLNGPLVCQLTLGD